jgi:hypothetical protein
MPNFTWNSTQYKIINFEFNETRNIAKNSAPVIQDKPSDLSVKFPAGKMEKHVKKIRGSDSPIVLRLGFH